MKHFKTNDLRLAALACVLLAGTGIAAWNAPPRVAPAASQTYTNPVIKHDFPDPSVLADRGVYYAYATNGAGGIMPCARSADLTHWTDLPDAMPNLPSWANPGLTWAPNVRAFTSGKRYVAYFCTHSKVSNSQALGVAVSASPAGPFVPVGDAPLVDQPALGGAIDPSCFQDSDGARYLVWKNDGNSKGQETWLWVQKLTPDGLHLLGTPKQLIKNDHDWERPLIEAPTLWKHGAKYYLFYSSRNYGDCSYCMGYAVGPTVFGPFTKPRDTPWQESTGQVCGPGGEDIITTPDGRPWMVYHAWDTGPGRYRSMNIDPLVWNGDVPYLLGPSRWPQPAPLH